MKPAPAALRWLPALAVLAVGIATLTPRPEQAAFVARTPPWCLLCGDLGLVDVLLNVLLFAPFGAALQLRGRRLGRIAALSLMLSGAVELLQALIPSRDPTLSDLLTNSTGGVLGGFVAERWHYLARPGPRLARRLIWIWAGLWLAQTGFTAAAVQPSLPSSWYWGQLAPELEQFEQFRGEVVRAGAGPYRMRSRRLNASAEVRAALLAGEPLTAMTTPGDPTPGLAPIVSIFDGQQREIVLVGRWGDDLVYRLRTRSFDLRLRPPAIRLPGAFAAGDTMLIGVSGRLDPEAGTFIASVSGPSRTSERAVPLSAQWGWSLLLPFPYAHGPESPWLTAVWVLAWMLPLGFWSVPFRWRAVLSAVVLLGTGLGLLPLLWRLAPGALPELFGAGGGLTLGAALRARVIRAGRTTRRAP